MRLIKTNDGLWGWFNSGKTTWCTSVEELKKKGIEYYRISPEERQYFCDDVDIALTVMRQYGHSNAEFGIFGSFMFTHDYEET